MLPNYFILGLYPLPVSPCTIYVYNDILISSSAWNGYIIEGTPPLKTGGRHFSWVSSPCTHSHCTFYPQGDCSWTTWRKEIEEEGLGEGPEKKRDLSHFRGELSSRPRLVVVYQILSKFFPKSNTLNLTTLTTQDIHFKLQSSAQRSISALPAAARIIILSCFMEWPMNKILTKQTGDHREFPF